MLLKKVLCVLEVQTGVHFLLTRHGTTEVCHELTGSFVPRRRMRTAFVLMVNSAPTFCFSSSSSHLLPSPPPHTLLINLDFLRTHTHAALISGAIPASFLHFLTLFCTSDYLFINLIIHLSSFFLSIHLSFFLLFFLQFIYIWNYL